MNFKRNDIQEYLESEMLCFDKTKWTSYKAKLLEWEISERNIQHLIRCSKSDVLSYYFKAIQTFSQALNDINEDKYVWSIIKLYYSTFFLLRCDVLLSNHIIVRCGGTYYAKLESGNKLQLYKNRKARGDHQMTIALIKKLHGDSEIIDPILGNEIEDRDAYTWLMKHRERVNYQMKEFSDPYPDEIFLHVKPYFKENKINDLLQFYNSYSDYSICFDIEHSIIAIPYMKIRDIFKKIDVEYNFSNKQLRKLATCLNMLRGLNLDKEKLSELMK